MIVSPRDGVLGGDPEIVAEIVAAVGEHRDGGSPFERRDHRTHPGGRCQGDGDGPRGGYSRDLVAGGLPAVAGEYGAALRRIEAGPPYLS